MNKREKEQYLREYAILKTQGKPFFPYAVMKDSLMACVVMAVIIGMSLLFGAELGSKANPTTTTYVPRPECTSSSCSRSCAWSSRQASSRWRRSVSPRSA